MEDVETDIHVHVHVNGEYLQSVVVQVVMDKVSWREVYIHVQ